MKKIICLSLIMLLFLTGFSSLNVYANSEDGEAGEVVMIVVPDSNGTLHQYTGSEAKAVYAQILQQSSISEPEESISSVDLPIEDEIEPCGPFHYRYRFVKESSGVKYGPQRRISNPLENYSSETQQMQITASSRTDWTINTSLSGKFKEVFEAQVGGSWSKNSSFSQTITANVGPYKRMWIEFRPIIRYVSGKSQKYFIPRGPVPKRPIVVESKSVYSTSPRSVYVTLGNQRFMATDGVYVWKESRLR